MLSLCGAPPRGLYKAPHDFGVCWKQFMMLLKGVSVCGGVSFHPPARPGSARVFASVWRVGAVPGLPVYCLISSVVDGVEVRPPLGDFGRALFRQKKRCLSSGVTMVSHLGCRTKGLPILKGGSVTSLRHPARSCARGAHSVKAFGRLKWTSLR